MGKRRATPRNRRFGGSSGRRPPALSARRSASAAEPSPARLRELPRSSAALSDIHSHLKQVLSYLEKRGKVKSARRYEVGVFLAPNAELRKMKKRFLGKAPKTVDVLAFPEPRRFPHPETRKIPLGEIYLNRRLVKVSPERGRCLLRHGLLHLLGYRHDRKSDTIKMQTLEKELNQHFYEIRPAIRSRLGHRNRIGQGGGRGKPRRPSGAQGGL